jgi:hypothetical protein
MIYIEVRGGVVQAVWSESGRETVVIVDHDESEGGCRTEYLQNLEALNRDRAHNRLAQSY